MYIQIKSNNTIKIVIFYNFILTSDIHNKIYMRLAEDTKKYNNVVIAIPNLLFVFCLSWERPRLTFSRSLLHINNFLAAKFL
jgi:hypothetical protein